jgi:DNA-directed RNA polymerase subunit RPC12/RpoP
MIEFKCPICSKFLKLPHSYAGKPTQCPGCLKTVTVPGSPPPAAQASARAPKSSAGGMQLCADCGNSFSTTEMMQHEGQGVCYTCYHKRKSTLQADAAARDRAAARKAGKRKRTIMLVIGVVVLIAGAVAAYLALA